MKTYEFDAEMRKIQANLKPQVKGEILEFCDTVFDAFDKLNAMSALYVDMSGLLEFVCEIKPACDCEGAHFCPDDNLHYPPHLCAYHQRQEDKERKEFMDASEAKEVQELNEKYRQMVWDMEAEDQHQAWLQGRSEHPDDEELPF